MEEYNKIKKILALGFIHFLDENRPEGKMCLSNGECAEIEKAFNEQDWQKLTKCLDKYIESEDERHRKWILEYLYDGLQKSDEQFKDQFKSAISWLEKQKELFESGRGLYYYDGEKTTYCGYPATEENPSISQQEKQKEQKPIAESKRLANEVIKYLTKCGYSPVLKDDSKKEHFHIDIPRHEDDFWLSEEYKHCRSVLGEYYMEGDYGGDTYTLYVWREKKETKPAEWSEDNIKELTEFEAAMLHIGMSFFGGSAGLNPNNTNEVKKQAKLLLELVPKQEWGEKDNIMLENTILCLKEYCLTDEITWLKSLRPPLKDKEMKLKILKYLSTKCSSLEFEEVENYLNNLRPSWKPSEEQMKALKEAADMHWEPDGLDPLYSLYEDLKKLM